MTIRHQLLTMTMIWDRARDRVLLLNRPDRKGFPGYIAPGGKVEYPESIVEAAVREVKEETGLVVTEMLYKGLSEFCNPDENLRYMVFNYLATAFEGELLEHPPEGELLWVGKDEALGLPMQGWFKERFPLFFAEGTFEHYSRWEAGTKRHQVRRSYPDSLRASR